MQLRAFLRSSGITDQQFADKIGRARSTVRKWIHRQRQPDAATIAVIQEATGGSVTLADWAEAAACSPIAIATSPEAA